MEKSQEKERNEIFKLREAAVSLDSLFQKLNGAAWLIMVRRGSFGNASACCKGGRVRFSARHHRKVFPTEHTSDEEMERRLSEWRRMNVIE